MKQYMVRRIDKLVNPVIIQSLRRMKCRYVRSVSLTGVQMLKRYKREERRCAYKNASVNGLYVEAYDYVRQRSYNNSMVRLDDQRLVCYD